MNHLVIELGQLIDILMGNNIFRKNIVKFGEQGLIYKPMSINWIAIMEQFRR